MQGWFEIKEDKLKFKASKEGLLHPRLQYGIELMGHILDEDWGIESSDSTYRYIPIPKTFVYRLELVNRLKKLLEQPVTHHIILKYRVQYCSELGRRYLKWNTDGVNKIMVVKFLVTQPDEALDRYRVEITIRGISQIKFVYFTQENWLNSVVFNELAHALVEYIEVRPSSLNAIVALRLTDFIAKMNFNDNLAHALDFVSQKLHPQLVEALNSNKPTTIKLD